MFQIQITSPAKEQNPNFQLDFGARWRGKYKPPTRICKLKPILMQIFILNSHYPSVPTSFKLRRYDKMVLGYPCLQRHGRKNTNILGRNQLKSETQRIPTD